MKLGTARGFRDLAVFLVVFAVLLELTRRGVADITGLLWWGFVLLGTVYLAWKSWRTRNKPHPSDGPGGWGAVLPPRVSRWMLGEDDADSKSNRR